MAQRAALPRTEQLVPLSRMKWVATSVLVLAAATFVLTYFIGEGGSAALFVRAAAEAAVIGGLADWFAVTALFRHPMGLRIPHTALIPRKKDELAGTLGTFVTNNFLTADNVRTHVARAQLVEKASDWLSLPPNAQTAAEILASSSADVLESFDRGSLATFALEFTDVSVQDSSPSQELGRTLKDWVSDGRHHAPTESLLKLAQVQGRQNREELADILRKFVEDMGVLGWLSISPGSSRRRIEAAIQHLADAEADSEHVIRRIIDELLADFASELASNSATSERLDSAISEWLRKDSTHVQTEELIDRIIQAALPELRDGTSRTVKRLAEMILSAAERVAVDEDLRYSMNLKVAETIAELAQNYGNELKVLIQTTVGGWSGEYASRQIELAAGKDLQFIRINGAVVGALAGIVIHGASLLL